VSDVAHGDAAERERLAQIYQAVFMAALGRRAEPQELAAWLDNGGQPTDPIDLAKALRTTEEFGDQQRKNREHSREALAEIYQSVFLAALGRRATADELTAWLDNAGQPTPPRALADTLRTTDEFGDRTVLDAAMIARRAGGRRVFFLRIPKTGSTSFVARLREALGGVPPIIYSREVVPLCLSPGDEDWPHLTGHVNFGDAARPTHFMATVFREPRAGILSKHRFIASVEYERYLGSINKSTDICLQWRSMTLMDILAAPDSLTNNAVSRGSSRRGFNLPWISGILRMKIASAPCLPELHASTERRGCTTRRGWRNWCARRPAQMRRPGNSTRPRASRGR
jgi:hypothetical protein